MTGPDQIAEYGRRPLNTEGAEPMTHRPFIEPEHLAESVCLHPSDENAWLSDDVFMCCACGQKFIANDPELIDGSND